MQVLNKEGGQQVNNLLSWRSYVVGETLKQREGKEIIAYSAKLYTCCPRLTGTFISPLHRAESSCEANACVWPRFCRIAVRVDSGQTPTPCPPPLTQIHYILPPANLYGSCMKFPPPTTRWGAFSHFSLKSRCQSSLTLYITTTLSRSSPFLLFWQDPPGGPSPPTPSHPPTAVFYFLFSPKSLPASSSLTPPVLLFFFVTINYSVGNRILFYFYNYRLLLLYCPWEKTTHYTLLSPFAVTERRLALFSLE